MRLQNPPSRKPLGAVRRLACFSEHFWAVPPLLKLGSQFSTHKMASFLLNITPYRHCCMNSNSKYCHFVSNNTFKPHIVKSRSLSQQSGLLPLKKLQVSLKPSCLPFLLEPKRNILKFCVEKLATFLLASVFLMGYSKSRPALALPVQENDIFERKDDAQNEKHSDEEEEVMCLKLLQENPKNIEALKMIVNLRMHRGKSNEVVEYVERLIEIQPKEIEWRLLQALCYEMMGNLSKAKSLFKNILKRNPLLIRALHGLAMVMHKNHEGPAVFDMLERALEVAHRGKKVNDERNIRILVAQMHFIKGELEEALQKFQVLIDENPRDFRPYLCQGIIYSFLNKNDEAEERFEMYRCLVPEEFPQVGFLDDVVLAAKTEPKQQLQKDLQC